MVVCVSQFLSPLITEQIGPFDHELRAEFMFLDDLVGVIKVPEGFRTDFASIQCLKVPLLYWLYALLIGYGNKAATIHDFLYRNGKHTRSICDEVFHRALLAEGVDEERAWLMYSGVRLGGASSYIAPRRLPLEVK